MHATMRKIAISNQPVSDLGTVASVRLNQFPITCELVHLDRPNFDPTKPSNANRVLIRVKAFSCNYRDKNLIFTAATQDKSTHSTAIGSEFVGEIVAVGADVVDLKIGDRVMGNNTYPDSGVPNVTAGVATNFASLEYRIMHQVKLVKVPDVMPDTVAAAFSLGAQTAYSMIRKAALPPGANVLVTAAKSNTSLFIIQALRHLSVNVYVTSTSKQFEAELLAMGVKQVILVQPEAESWIDPTAAQAIQQETGGFDSILDPFFDLHIGRLLPALKSGGRYITCGLYDQYSEMIGQTFEYQGLNLNAIFTMAIMNNLHLIGNCLGSQADLDQAIADYQSGNFDILVDSVFSGNQIGEFLERTYSHPDRFGKVVYQYD
jgi:NADPH:quinone reductase-like Zn-dependent oxidoreductase